MRRPYSGSRPGDHQIDVGYGEYSNVLIEDVEIDGLGGTGFGAGIGNAGFTCRRCNIHA